MHSLCRGWAEYNTRKGNKSTRRLRAVKLPTPFRVSPYLINNFCEVLMDWKELAIVAGLMLVISAAAFGMLYMVIL